MIFLLLAVVGGVAFNQCLRYGQKHGANILATVAVNYGVATVVSLAILFARGVRAGQLLDAHVIAIAFINGVLYLLHLLVVLAAYQTVGVGITAALSRAGIIVPAVAAWLAWNETMNAFRWIGLGLVPVAMVLMRRHEQGKPRLSLAGDMVLLGCFGIAGAIMTLHKYAEVHFTLDQREVYKSLLFAVATAAAVGYTLARRMRYSKGDVALGVVIGLINATMLLIILAALSKIAAVVFFPTVASLEICLNVFAARLLWRERLLKRQLLGLAIAVGVVLLTNASSR